MGGGGGARGRGGSLTVDRQRDNEENQDAGERRESPASRGKARFPPLHGGLRVVVSHEELTNQKQEEEFAKRFSKAKKKIQQKSNPGALVCAQSRLLPVRASPPCPPSLRCCVRSG